MRTGLVMLTAASVLGLALNACGNRAPSALDDRPSTEVAGSPTGTAEASEYEINGSLDCKTGRRFGGAAVVTEGAEGASTPEEALRSSLGGYAEDVPGASVVIVGDRKASVVVDGREVVTTRASRYDGGWFALEVSGCDDGWRDPVSKS